MISRSPASSMVCVARSPDFRRRAFLTQIQGTPRPSGHAMLWNTRDENQRRELLRLANLPHVWHARAWLSFTHRERLRLFQAMTRVECDRSVDLGLCL